MSFLSTTCVLFMEILKLSACSILLIIETGGESFSAVLKDSSWRVSRWERFLVCVPAFAYAVQNNLYYIALANIDATTYTVTYQLRILTTALLSVWMLGKEISALQWVALSMSGVGVVLVQVSSRSGSKLIGVLATLGMCWTSAFAGFFQGWTSLVWTMTVAAAAGGIVVSAVMKYADNVKKTYCQTLAIGKTIPYVFLAHHKGIRLGKGEK
ncbi:unnamed protein product [Heligmosomoides polygyrus]|uniref:Uncharacterized protein n=1 Tax=Heligmosomoides polygyrus TaxID=6339 RepID=A0A3P7ZRM5_HELPZ|nr:unnamed protein product [Heligmosomoides polygyrus]